MRLSHKDGPTMKMRLNFGMSEVKFAKDADPGTFEGYGSVFSTEDLGGDVILPGAFKASLAAWKAKGKLPKMLWQHGYDDNAIPVGVWTSMAEDSKGLAVQGKLIALDTDRGKQLHEGMMAGAIDAMSITYVATDVVYGQKDNEPFRTIRALDLYEVGPVLFGMNEDALISDAKSLAREIKTIREFEAFLRDAGWSREASKAIASEGFKANPQPRDEGGVAAMFEDLHARAASIFRNT